MRIIAGLYKNRPIAAPKGLETRPTSGRLRESLFNICQADIAGARFLDLFAGSGAMGFEALSRGGEQAVFIDSSRECQRCIVNNGEKLGVTKQIQVICGDVFDQLPKLAKRGVVFDIIYVDPPYIDKGEAERALSARVLDFIDENSSLLSLGGHLFLEDAHGALEGVAEKSYRHLIFKSTRRMGRSELHHFIKREG